MTNEDNSSVINDSESVKLLYEVLLEEYIRLEIFSEKDAENIVKEAKKQKLKNSDADKRRREFGNLVMAKIRYKVHEKVAKSKPPAEKKKEETKRKKAAKEKPFAALCFSGGGIRSATFNLGILQGMARHNLLEKFHYLSTVSGGGYIGSWLSAWIFRSRGNAKVDKNGAFSTDFVKNVQKELTLNRDIEVEEGKTKLSTDELHEVEPLEITHLRSYSNYMSPRPGLFTVDTWTLIVVYLRNLLLNWTVMVPILAAILLLPRLFYGIIVKSRDYLPFTKDFGGEDVILFGLSILAGSTGVGCMIAMRPTFREYFWRSADDLKVVKSKEPGVLLACICSILFLAFGFTVFWAWFQRDHFQFVPPIYLFIIYGIVLYGGGGLLALGFAWIRKIRTGRKKLDKKVFYFWGEVFAALASGVIGGILLYLVVDIFSAHKDTRYFMLMYACFGIPLFIVVFLLSATVFIGIASKITDDMDREWLSRFGAMLLIFAVLWSVMSSIVLLGQFLFKSESIIWANGVIASVGGISGIITLVLGFSRKSTADGDKAPKSKTGFLLWFAPQVAAPIFALFLMIVIAYVTYLLMLFVGKNIGWLALPINFLLSETVNETTGEIVRETILLPNFRVSLVWIAVLAGIGALMGWFVNINKFSLHATYRERLIRSYLGASRAEERVKTANIFTGLDDKDNVEMKELLQRPFHVVNMTLNLASTKNLRWQNRKAESFTATALHCGSSNMDEGTGSYRDSESYARNAQSGRSISLGTAAAISGAAASPNMGYYTSSSAVSFLMALFNVRLGWWLGNPGKPGDTTYHLPAPTWSPKVFFTEAFGLTTDSRHYIYLSDGGHFDNLGLYEMVLRRVHLIVVCDSGADADFGFNDFGTAIHKIRVDMGIPIEFKGKKDAPTPGRNCGIATIKYSEIDGSDPENDGILIYIKPTLDGDEPIDIVNYKASNPDFPHEGTADQMYSETQFESYRKLGFHMINSFCCKDDNSPCEKCFELSDLVENAKVYLRKHREPDEIGDKKKEVEKKILAFLGDLKFPNQEQEK